jgi:hypothetical protein
VVNHFRQHNPVAESSQHHEVKIAEHALEVAKFHHQFIRGPVIITGNSDQLRHVQVMTIDRVAGGDREITHPQKFADNTGFNVEVAGKHYHPQQAEVKVAPAEVYDIVDFSRPRIGRPKPAKNIYAGSITRHARK